MKGRDIEREYMRVKKSLEVLGYKDPLGIDSVSIVNKVLNDLIKTTEGFKKLQDERDKLRNELKSQGDLVLPFRNENIRLTKENNELHQEMIKLKDALEKNSNANMQNRTKTQNEKDEFKLLLSQKDSLIKTQQAEIDSLKQKMNDLFDKLYLENVNSNGNTTNIISKTNTGDMLSRKVVPRGGFEISAPLDTQRGDTTEKNLNLNLNEEMIKRELDNYNLNKESWMKDLKLADSEAEKLRNEIRNLKKQISEQETSIQTLRNKVSNRDSEINSLQMNKFIGDDNKEELKIKYNAENLKEINDKLQAQIDFLNEENHKLQSIEYFHTHRCREEEIKKLDNQIALLQKENEILKNQIESINNTNKAKITKEKKINNEGINKLNEQIKKLNNEIIIISSEKKKLEKENLSVQKELLILNDTISKYKEVQDVQISNFNSERLGLT